MATPGSKDDTAKAQKLNQEDYTELKLEEEPNPGDEVELSGSEATKYRGVCARLNYLAQDRPDVRYACKEASRWMARPRLGHWLLLKYGWAFSQRYMACHEDWSNFDSKNQCLAQTKMRSSSKSSIRIFSIQKFAIELQFSRSRL